MPYPRFLRTLALLSAAVPAWNVLPAQSSTPPAAVQADFCVYGGTSGGVVGAVQAARMGKKAVLLEPTGHLGGMCSGGLSNVDIGNPKTVGGLTREYLERVGAKYNKPLQTQLEPHVAEQVFNEMVKEAGVEVHLHATLASVTKENGNITALVATDGTVYRAKTYLDATYEGDLLAKAGVSYTLTREANSQYGETLNGVVFQKSFMPVVEWGKPGPNGRRPDGMGVWDRDIPVDPYVVKGDPSSGLLPLVQPDVPGPLGSAAPGVQAYCYRMAMTAVPENRIPFTEPPGYDARQYELVARYIEACVAAGDDMDMFWFIQDYKLPNDKFDFNTATYGSDLAGTGQAWCEATPEQRAAVGRQHEIYQRGLYWFLTTDPRVPKKVRDQLGQYGYCKDEFADNGGWPYQLYVREGRRMISDFVLTQDHVKGVAAAPNGIALGSYGIDTHFARRLVYNGMVVREDKLGSGVPHPYPIGYGAIVPKASECGNLFVTFAISASHVAFASTRMEPVLMELSQAAATAAAFAIDDKVPVQQVDYAKLRARLLADKQVLEYPVP